MRKNIVKSYGENHKRDTCFCYFLYAWQVLEMVSLVAMTVLLVLISQCIGVLKFKIEKMCIAGSDSDIIPVFYVCDT